LNNFKKSGRYPWDIEKKVQEGIMLNSADIIDILKHHGIYAHIDYDPGTRRYFVRATKGQDTFNHSFAGSICNTRDCDLANERKKVVEDIINHFEKENAMNNNNIKRRVCDVKIDSSMYNGMEISCKLEGRPDPIGRVNPMTLQDDLEKKLNAKERDDSVDAYYKYMVSSLYGMKKIEPSTKLPEIKKVIFNDPATIVIWADDTKTVVKAENEPYDAEKGLAMAITKKALGNEGKYYNKLKPWLEEYEKQQAEVNAVESVFKKLHDGICRVNASLTKKAEKIEREQKAIDVLHMVFDDKKATKADLKVAILNALTYLEPKEKT